MNNWIKSILIGLGVAGLVYVFVERPKKGGILGRKDHHKRFYSVDYTMLMKATGDMNGAGVKESVELLEKRLERTKCSFEISLSPNMTYRDSLLFTVKLKGITDTLAAAELVSSSGLLEIMEMYTRDEVSQFGEALIKAINKKSLTSNKDSITIVADSSNELLLYTKEYEQTKQAEKQSGEMLSITSDPTSIGAVKISDTAVMGELLRSPEIKAVLPPNTRYCYGSSSSNKTFNQNKDPRLPLYLLNTRGREKAFLRNEDVTDADTDFAYDDRVMVTFTFSAAGTHTWEKLTSRNVRRPLAIIVGDKVITAPVVSEKITGGRSQINGDFTFEEAEAIANMIKMSPLPVKPQIIQSQITNTVDTWTRQKLFKALLAFVFSVIASLLIFKALKPT